LKNAGIKDFHTFPVEVVVDKNLKPFKLVLSKEGSGYGDDEKPAPKPPQPQ